MKRYFLILLLLAPFFAGAQSGTGIFSAIRSRVADSTTVVTPAGYGIIYYNAQSNKFRVYANGAWSDLGAAGGGGGTVTGSGTTNQLAYWTGSSALGTLSTATYPGLTELSYVKGVTSSIQTQLGTKWELTGTNTIGPLDVITASNSFVMSDIAIPSQTRIFNFSTANIGIRHNTSVQLIGGDPFGTFKKIELQGAGITYTLGSDATGDTYYRNSSGYFTRLPAGTNGHVLTLAAGIPSWAAPSGGGLTVGTSTITSGTNTRVLYNNSGVLGEYTVSGSGNVAMTTSPVFTTPNIGTATGTASGNWFGTGTTTLSGAATIVGTTSNTQTHSFSSLGTTATNVYNLINTTDAAAGAQQISPPFLRRGNGWKTNATAASQTVDFIDYVTPVQGASAPTGYWSMYSSINGGANSENFRIRSDGALFLTGGSGFAANIFLGTSGDAYIGRGTSGTNGVFLYGPAATANIYTFSVSSTSSNNYNYTSGTGGTLGLPGNFNPSSGTGIFYNANATGTINMTGTSSGNVFVYGNNQTVTAAKGNYTGFYHNPTVTSITGTHNAFHATSGNLVLDNGTATISGDITSQGQRIRNTGTTGSDVYRREQDWAMYTVSASSGNNDYNLFLSDVIQNSTCTVEVTVTGVSSDGVKSYSKKMYASFRKPGTSDMAQVSSTVDEYEHTNDLTSPVTSLSVVSDALRVSFDSGTGAPTIRWTITVKTNYSTW